jgi:ParB family chromosome partitioning protein
VEMLEPSPFQPRGPMDPEALEELTDSIRARGILQPLLARAHPTAAGRYQIIAGERRWRAAQAAGLHEVPVLVRALTDADAMAAGLVENLQRQDLNPIEEAEGYRRLLDEFGVSQDQLGQAVGKSRSHVANTLRLLTLPEKVRIELKKGTVTAGHARALLMHPEPEAALAIVLARGLNVRQAEALAKAPSATQGATSRPKPVKDPETATLERELSERLGLKVEIAFDGKGGNVRIHYKSLDQLDGILAKLSGT